MTWHQHAMNCADALALGLTNEQHDECIAIACEDDVTGAVAWVSHDHQTVDHAVRANPDVPGTDWTGAGT